jgi:hypothetical protein
MSAFRSIHFVGGFLVHEECWTVHDEADSPQVQHGHSVFLGALLEVRVAILDGLRPPRRQSTPSSRTVCPDTAESPPGAFQIALSPLLFELCFHVGLIWDLFLWLVCLL